MMDLETLKYVNRIAVEREFRERKELIKKLKTRDRGMYSCFSKLEKKSCSND
jgi:hypothetical protein